jgi:mono/diheme cytochrome c family protein
MHFRTVIIICLIVAACSNENTAKQDKRSAGGDQLPVIEKGKILFVTHCAACHGNNGKAGITGASDLQVSRLDSTAIFQTIKNGRTNMPAYGGKITANEIRQLTLYVDHLKSK